MYWIGTVKRWCCVLAAMSAGAAAHAALVHLYEFDGSLNDTLGGPALVSNGGTLGSGSYSFGANQGLTLNTDPALAGNYSIGIQFSFQSVSGWNKIVDFSNRVLDEGQYIFNGALNFFPITNGPAVIDANEMIDVVFTRSSADNLFTAYLNGSIVSGFSFTDSDQLGVATIIDSLARFSFFMDDAATSFNEASAGTVHEIRIWDEALAAGEIPGAFVAIPEPSTLLFLLAGLSVMAVYFRPRAA